MLARLHYFATDYSVADSLSRTHLDISRAASELLTSQKDLVFGLANHCAPEHDPLHPCLLIRLIAIPLKATLHRVDRAILDV